MGLNTIISISIIMVLAIIIYQDLKFRFLDVKYAVLLLLLCIWYHIENPLLNYGNILLILGFIGLNLVLLIAYFSLKKGRFFNPIDRLLGLGDIVFFMAIAPLFLVHQYILFFISGLLFSLVLTLSLRLVTKKEKNLPLAGYMSIYLGSIFLINLLFNKAFLNLGLH